jgi:hypothetical protein
MYRILRHQGNNAGESDNFNDQPYL